MKKIFFIIFTYLPLLAFAQKEKSHWYFGQLAGLDFSSGSPVFNSSDVAMRSFLASTVISDSMGNLLFYANSGTTVINGNDTLKGVVCNRFHQVMPHGILGDTLTTQWYQSCIILPKVGDKNKYYLFTVDPSFRLNKGLRYSIIDMSLDSGKGDIVQKGVPVIDSIVEGTAATAHANGVDYWLMVGRLPPGRWNGLTNYNAYKISASGISPPVITPEDPQNIFSGGGSYKFSPDGNLFYTSSGVYDFDNNTGQLSNFRTLGYNGVYNCVEFSPDSKVLYAINSGDGVYMHQFDLTASDIASSDMKVDSGINYYDNCGCKGDLMLGPDGKIYVSLISDSVSVINNPNVPGLGCNYRPNQISLNGRSSLFTFPNFASKYSGYINNSIDTVVVQSVQISISPNPFSGSTTILYGMLLKNASLILYNSIGQKMEVINNINGQTIVFNRGNFATGIYFARLIQDNKILATVKLLITDE